jgi:Effector-associated domain 8
VPTLESTLKDMWAWRDTLIAQNERDICIFARELDAPFLRIRTNLQNWQEETRVRFVPWRDVDGIERLEKPEEKREWIKDLLGLTGVSLPDKVVVDPKDSGPLIRILAAIDYFQDPMGRKTLLNLCGLQRFTTGVLVNPMAPTIAAGTFLTELSSAGRLAKQGDHALGALLRFVHDRVDSLPPTDADFIQSVLIKYQLTAQESDEDS